MPSDQIRPLPADRPRISRPDPFTPAEAAPPSRPNFKPEEGERGGESLATIGSALLVLGAAAVVAWVLYLALG